MRRQDPVPAPHPAHRPRNINLWPKDGADLAARRSIAQPAHLLREDPDLAGVLAPGERERAAAECVAPVARLPRGSWHADRMLVMSDGIGLLVLDGLLIRRVGVD